MGNPRDEAGASDKLAGCSQASTPKPDEIQRLRPWEPEPRIQLRRRLSNASLHALARARRARSTDAELLYRDIARIASDWSIEWRLAADAEIESQLQDILGALTRMFLAADALERNGSGL